MSQHAKNVMYESLSTLIFTFYFYNSYESGVLEDPAKHAPSGIYQMTVDPEQAPDQAERIVISFKNGKLRERGRERMLNEFSLVLIF